MTARKPNHHHIMSNTTETTKPVKPATIVTSPETKAWVQAQQEKFVAPGKTPGKMVAASEREVTNALVAFVQGRQFETREETAEDGSTRMVEFDAWAHEMRRELALRETTTRANTAKAENESLKAQLAELQAKLAALTGGGTDNL